MLSAMRSLAVLSLLAVSFSVAAAYAIPSAPSGPLSIVDFGAVSGDNSSATAVANSQAIIAAFTAASQNAQAPGSVAPSREQRWSSVLDFSDASRTHRSADEESLQSLFYTPAQTVLVPSGQEFFVSWTVLKGFSNVLFWINGTLRVTQDESTFASAPNGDFGVFQFEDCTAITVQGKTQSWGEGVLPTSEIDVIGDGWSWWWTVLLGKYDHRPHLFYMQRCVSFVFYSLYVTDSPQYHFLTSDSADFLWKNFTVKVDVNQQTELAAKAGHEGWLLPGRSSTDDGVQWSLPTFPLNTDGVDPSATNVIIEDFYIENYDDAVAVKPCQEQDSLNCPCASDMTIRNGAVKFSVGLTIGSVPPNVRHNCVRNITFDSIRMLLPFKALYIKSNPGTQGTGTIDGITYSNIDVASPLWYPIWIGPQQQKQPANGSDTGCSFFYPLNSTCATNPLVSMTNIALSNVTLHGGLTLPGVILCDPANPCENLSFEGVNNTAGGSWLVSSQYSCHNAQVMQQDNSPEISCSMPPQLEMEQETQEESAGLADGAAIAVALE